MKKQAWTMAELAVAIVIILIISCICTSIFKPNIQKAKFYAYAAVNNIRKGNAAVIEKSNTLKGDDIDGNDWYCLNLADNFSLDSAINCSTTAGNDDVNISFPNGTTVMGLASAWKAPYEGANFFYKNILIDIDGPSNGKNKVWVDRFPMRIIAGSGKGAEGLVMPINCLNDVVYNSSQGKDIAVDESAKSPYCPSSGAKNYGIDDQILTYDIYRLDSKAEGAKAHTVASLLSPMQADCAAYGGKIGYYSVEECAGAGFKILSACAVASNCSSYKTSDGTAYTFPDTSTTEDGCSTIAQEKNPDGLSCFAIPHKPSGGTSFIMQALIGDIDNI